MAYYDAFVAKWATMPSTGTTEQKLTGVNAATAVGPPIPMIVPTYKVYNLITAADYTALSTAAQQTVRDILYMGTVDASSGTQIRSRIIATFPSSTQTFANLQVLAASFDAPTVSWWSANGYPRPFDMGDVQAAGVS